MIRTSHPQKKKEVLAMKSNNAEKLFRPKQLGSLQDWDCIVQSRTGLGVSRFIVRGRDSSEAMRAASMRAQGRKIVHLSAKVME